MYEIRFLLIPPIINLSPQDLFSVRMNIQHWSSLKEVHVLLLHLYRYDLIYLLILNKSYNIKPVLYAF